MTERDRLKENIASQIELQERLEELEAERIAILIALAEEIKEDQDD